MDVQMQIRPEIMAIGLLDGVDVLLHQLVEGFAGRWDGDDEIRR